MVSGFFMFMMTDDTYKTIEAFSAGEYSEKRSKFLAFAHPVRSVVKALVPFLLAAFVVLAIICFVPQTATWLPQICGFLD